MRALSLISVVALLLGIAGSSADSSIPSPKSSVSVTKTSSTEKSLKNSRKGHSNNKNLTPTKDKIDSNRNKKILKKSKRFYHKIPKDIEEIPVAVNDQNITFQLVLRSIFLFMVFTPIILTSGLAYISVFFRTYVWYRMITLGITAGGAAFIKWGQWASTRPDMFPETFCALLSELQSNAPVHGFAYTQRLVWEQLGQPIEEVFDSFPRTPIASGSIAQVYKAVYKGQPVAVKVRHPGVELQIKLDFIIMKAVAAALENALGLTWLNLSESLAQFSHTIAAQTSLDVEGGHLWQLNHNFRHWKDVSFPRPIVVTSGVLVESWEWGQITGSFLKTYVARISKCVKAASASTSSSGGRRYDNLEFVHCVQPNDLRTAFFLVTRGEDLYLKMLFQDNLMHADLHPGNIIVQPNHRYQHFNSHDTKGSQNAAALPENSIVLVDAGMVAELTRREQVNFMGLLECIGEGDSRGAADHILDFSTVGRAQYSPQLVHAFRADMKVLFSHVARGYGTDMDIGQILRGMLGVVRDHHVTIETNYATLVMNALCLDGMAANLLPNYNVMDAAKPLFRFHRRASRIPLLSHSRWLIDRAMSLMLWIKKRGDQEVLRLLEALVKAKQINKR